MPLIFTLSTIILYYTIYILKIKRLERNAMRKKKGEKTKSLLFQSNISKTRYNKKRLILNLLLDSASHNDET